MGTDRTVWIMDDEALHCCPIPREIKKDEMAALYPERSEVVTKKTYVFKYKKIVAVPEREATFLFQKYDSLHEVLKTGEVVEDTDNFESMQYLSLRKLAKDYGITWADSDGMKKPELIMKMRKAKAEGKTEEVVG